MNEVEENGIQVALSNLISELGTLRDQVKILQVALEKVVSANPTISFNHTGAFEYLSAVEYAREVLRRLEVTDDGKQS